SASTVLSTMLIDVAPAPPIARPAPAPPAPAPTPAIVQALMLAVDVADSVTFAGADTSELSTIALTWLAIALTATDAATAPVTPPPAPPAPPAEAPPASAVIDEW